MSQAYISPELEGVYAEVSRRGFSLDHRARGIVSLNEPHGEPRKADGARKRRPLPYNLHERDLRKVVSTSMNSHEAAERFITICKTNQDPGPGHRNLSQTQIDDMVTERAKGLLQEMGLTPEMLARLKGEEPPTNGTRPDGTRSPEAQPAPKQEVPKRKRKTKKRKSRKSVDLTEREWKAIELRDSGKTLRDAAAEMGISHARVSQLYKRGKEKLGQQAS